MKNIVKFKFQDNEGFLSVVEKSNHFYALVQKETPKVKEVQEKKQLLISYELKTPNYKEVSASILFDQELIKWVYDKLESEKNLYFKELDDSLCVLEIPKL
jgi:general stress protein 26